MSPEQLSPEKSSPEKSSPEKSSRVARIERQTKES